MNDEQVLQRSALLRSVTHDLRTPLAAIRAIVTDLHDGPPHDEATTQDLLQTVCDEVDRLDRLVGNLLSMSRIDADALEPDLQAIDVDELMEHRLKALAPLLRDHVVAVDIDPECPLVEADYSQVEEVLTNLVGNAVRHAPEGTVVTIAASATGDGSVLIAVIDRGPGIEPERQAELRRPFVRGHGSRSTGLGLAICDAIVRGHGGELTITTTDGGGATVGFTLPIAREVDREAEPRP